MAKLYTVTLTLPDGRRKYYRGRTREAAEAKRDKDKMLLRGGVNIADESTFRHVAELWFDLYKEDSLKPKSKEIIAQVFRCHVYPTFGEKKIKSIKPADILLLMKRVSKYSNSLQSKVLRYTKAVFNFAVENDLIPKSPVISTIRAGGGRAEEVPALSDDQCVALLDAVRGTRAYLFVELLLYTGLRRGEALGLMWQDIDFDKATLYARRSVSYTKANTRGEINDDMKTSASRRKIPIVRPLLDDLRTARAESTSLYVFSMANGEFLSEASFTSLWGIVERRVIDSSMKHARKKRTLDFKVHPHQLRHTCITRWIENGLDVKEVQYLAGHANPHITMQVYAHYRKEQLWDTTAAKVAVCSLEGCTTLQQSATPIAAIL